MAKDKRKPSADLFDEICDESKKLFRRKNKQYGDAIWYTGVLGASVELIGAVARLPQLVLRDREHGRKHADKLKDIFMDIHNYSNIAIMMLDANNWEGEFTNVKED